MREGMEMETKDRVCPECEAGKHGNCNGTAWDHEKDEPATCECPDPGHG